MKKTNPFPLGDRFAFNLFGDPCGNRTHDSTVKGWCLNLLTKGPQLDYFIMSSNVCQAYYYSFFVACVLVLGLPNVFYRGKKINSDPDFTAIVACSAVVAFDTPSGKSGVKVAFFRLYVKPV